MARKVLLGTKENPKTEEQKNHLGMPSHSTDQFAFWKTKEEELNSVRTLWGMVLSDKPLAMREKALLDLMRWAASERAKDEQYTHSDEGYTW